MYTKTLNIITAAAAFLAIGFASNAVAQDASNYYVHTDENREFVLVDLNEATAQATQAISVKLDAQINADITRRTHILNERPLNMVQYAETQAVNTKIENMLAQNHTQMTNTLMAQIDASVPTVPTYDVQSAIFAEAEKNALVLASLQQ